MQVERGKEGIDIVQLRIVAEREMDPSASANLLSIGSNCILHRVSKMDTLAGIAIKYGVEVADIKRTNGLVTDLQMFAHNSLQIPLPGRHPPSSVCQGGSTSDQEPTNGLKIDIFTSLHSLKINSPQRVVSPAMSSLQGYYALSPSGNSTPECKEKAVYTGLQDAVEHKKSIHFDPNQTPHRRSRSLANEFPLGNELLDDLQTSITGETKAQKSNMKLEHRHSQADMDQACRTPVLLLKDDISNSSGFSGITGNSLALRRAAPSADTDSGRMNHYAPMRVVSIPDGFSGFRKSSSLSNLQDSEDGSSFRPTTKWTKRLDSQSTSTGSTARMNFDGLPKPLMTRRNKAAID